MSIKARLWMAILAAILCGPWGSAHGEVEVTVTLKGPMEEILPILDLIQDIGAGSSATGEDAFRLNVDSEFTGPDETPGDGALPVSEGGASEVKPLTETPAPPKPSMEASEGDPSVSVKPQPDPSGDKDELPTPNVSGFSVEPTSAQPGEAVLATVELRDPDDVVDTMAFAVDGLEDQSFDLFDNGSHGDAKAGDGVWSARLPLPGSLAPGAYTLDLAAYDRYGDPIMVETPDGIVPLQSRTTLKVPE